MKPYLPLISEDMFDQAVSWIWEYALQYNYIHLVNTMMTRIPNIGLKVELKEREGLAVKFFLFLLKHSGCTAEIISPELLTSLESALVSYISSHPSIYERIDQNDMMKLVTSLRFLHVNSILLSSKYNASDVKKLVCKYFPDISDLNDSDPWIVHYMKIYHVQEVDEDMRQKTIASHHQASKYFTHKLSNIAEERKKTDKSGSAVKVWEKIEDIVWRVMSWIEKRTPRCALEGIEPGLSKWFDFLLFSIGDRTELALIKCFNNLLNLKAESDFFLSGFYKPETGGNHVINLST